MKPKNIEEAIARAKEYATPTYVMLAEEIEKLRSSLSYAQWTTSPDKTGAYWEQIDGFLPSIVWIHEGKVFGIIKTTITELNDVEYCVDRGAMYYGPLEFPQPMPSKKQ